MNKWGEEIIGESVEKKNLYAIKTILVFSFCVSTCAHASIRDDTKEYPADIAIWIADLRYDDGMLKILEFGQGVTSCFQNVYSPKEQTIYFFKKEIWTNFWKYLKQFDMPFWYIGDLHYKIDLTGIDLVGGYRVSTEKDLHKHDVFKKLITPEELSEQEKQVKQAERAIKDPYNIRDYRGIIVPGRGRSRQIPMFHKNYPDFVTVGAASEKHVRNKYLTSLLFQDDELWKYRPQCKAYEKKYYPELAQAIIAEFKCDTYVIKPLASCRGRGVIITKAQDLDACLKRILTEKHKLRSEKDIAYNHWHKDKSSMFIVEECVSSKKIMADGKTYDPTMRVVCALDYNQQKVNITFLGAFWKLSYKAQEEEGSLTEKVKSASVVGPLSTALVDNYDLENVYAILSNVLPKVYVKMLETKSDESRLSACDVACSLRTHQDVPATLLNSMYE